MKEIYNKLYGYSIRKKYVVDSYGILKMVKLIGIFEKQVFPRLNYGKISHFKYISNTNLRVKSIKSQFGNETASSKK